jgi:hypothetical protein
MNIETKYNYEKTWTITNEKDLLKIIEDEIGGDGADGVLKYIKESIAKGKTVSVGDCKFRKRG